MSNSATWNLLVDNYQSDDYPRPRCPPACDVTLLNTITADRQRGHGQEQSGAYLFDNGDEAFVVRAGDACSRSRTWWAQATNVPFPTDEFFCRPRPTRKPGPRRR